MRNFLIFYYNIDVENIEHINDNESSFYLNYDKYYIHKLTRPKEEVEEIYNILSNIKSNYNIIITNKEQRIVSEWDKKNYVLVKNINVIHDEINLIEIVKSQKTVIPSKLLNRNNWKELWSSKIDYLEYQVSERAASKKIIVKSFSYFVGMAENAIQYLGNMSPTRENLFISHKRVNNPNYAKDFYNPLNIVVDYRVRDIAEYIKSYYTKEYDNTMLFDEIKKISKYLSYNDTVMLYARLLYPSNYFDLIVKIMDEDLDDNVLIDFITNTKEYERFLTEVFNILNSKHPIKKIDWLSKKRL